MQLANKRQGTQSTLTRAEVRVRSKTMETEGYGQARHTGIRSPSG